MHHPTDRIIHTTAFVTRERERERERERDQTNTHTHTHTHTHSRYTKSGILSNKSRKRDGGMNE